MINTEPGKQLGRIYIPNHYDKEGVAVITTHLLLIPVSHELHQYNWEIIGYSDRFEPLNDMESVPTYDLHFKWENDNKSSIKEINLTRLRGDNGL